MPSDKKYFGFSKNIFYLGLASFFTDIGSEMIYPLLPVFLTEVLRAPIAFVGLVEGIAESTASVLKFIFGWVSDRFAKRKIFVTFGYIISSTLRPMIALAVLPIHVLLLRFGDRVGKGIRTAPRDALIADTCFVDERGKAFGFNRAMDHAGAMIGPIIAFFLLAYFTKDYRLIFALTVIPSLIVVFIVLFLIKEKKDSVVCAKEPLKLNLNIFDKKFKIFLLTVLIFTLGNSSDAFLLLRAKHIGVPIATLPLLWILLHLVKMASSLPGGILSDKIGRKKTIISGWLIYSLVYLGFAFARAPMEIYFLFAIYGFFFGLTESAEKAFVSDLVRDDQRGSAYGVYNFAIGISALPASLIMGILWQAFGVQIAFTFGAILALISAGMMATVRRPRS